MKYKYQIITLGSDVKQKQEILNQINIEIENLDLPEGFVKVIQASSIETEYIGNQPAFALYFGDVNGDFKDLNVTQNLLKDGTMILPIFYDEFNSEIPSILSNQNAIQYKKSEVNRIANIVLEAFELLRSTRKVFISYRRAESTSTAIQLYEAMEAKNFDVFLDTHSIQKGEPFQDELWHRMTDCDVIVLLNTPGFLESHWCKEEFAEAGAKQIGIVQLVWPNHKIKEIESSSQISYPIQLTEDNFVDKVIDHKAKLILPFLEKVIQEVESVRARNLAARQDNLITEFRNIAMKYNRIVTVQPEKFLTEDLPNGEHIIYVPTIGVPQSSSCQSAEIKKELMGYKDVSIRLIYDDLRIRDKWLKHLEWLNDNFKKDIKTLKKQDFESWLQKV
ncbi:toll/interleukin-1 receptor domain-containing protein [Cyclobacterium plantarum]|uniref:Toll/interleukin-1 receptor domain-containing protein n=1 Tax=Cyclobacterium plantarum TaxID=2716263 RepID=A0ABX0H1W7_9BACT|nr:toll/interleukin-1 receptor domain-containing protein [Cyclobacterium plantarum]NHE55791.1 toll/interleukin-1 receptor domain-containing protein [Cyclobacterium plantarum]